MHRLLFRLILISLCLARGADAQARSAGRMGARRNFLEGRRAQHRPSVALLCPACTTSRPAQIHPLRFT